jgi:hypothetical protein
VNEDGISVMFLLGAGISRPEFQIFAAYYWTNQHSEGQKSVMREPILTGVDAASISNM